MPSGALVPTRRAAIENEVDDDACYDQHGAHESEAPEGFAKGEKCPGRRENDLAHADHVSAERRNTANAAGVEDTRDSRAHDALAKHERPVHRRDGWNLGRDDKEAERGHGKPHERRGHGKGARLGVHEERKAKERARDD